MKKRQHLRIVVAMKVALRDEPQAPRDLTKNLSAGGLFLLTERRWSPGTKVPITLEHPGFDIHVVGAVTHAQEDGVGMRFEIESEEQRAQLCAMLDFLLTSAVPYDGHGGLDAGSVLWRRGLLEHEGLVTDIFAGGAFIESTPMPQAGESITVLLPSKNDGETREIVGCTARVSLATSDGFSVSFDRPSAEFEETVRRLAKVIAALPRKKNPP